jgi:hypothetical protein
VHRLEAIELPADHLAFTPDRTAGEAEDVGIRLRAARKRDADARPQQRPDDAADRALHVSDGARGRPADTSQQEIEFLTSIGPLPAWWMVRFTVSDQRLIAPKTEKSHH